MFTARWTTLGSPQAPTIAYVRGVGKVRVTQEDVDRYGESFLEDDSELLLERVLDDPEARFRITGPAPRDAWPPEDPAEREAAQKSVLHAHPKRGGQRSWLAKLFSR
ncbi:MAG: hypothetical protein ACOX9R_16410 [Armatimonadota bacterium]|jgi:hypothetical protein